MKKRVSVLIMAVIFLLSMYGDVLAEVVPDNPAGTIVGELAQGDSMRKNSGTITTNMGTVSENADGGVITTNKYETGVIETNNGTVGRNEGKITINNGVVQESAAVYSDFPVHYGHITTNNGTIIVNQGTISTNNGVIENTWNIITNNGENGNITTNKGSIQNNYGTVTNNEHGIVWNHGTVEKNKEFVGTNTDTVVSNSAKVLTNAVDGEVNINEKTGEVTTNNGTVAENLGVIKTNTETGIVKSNEGTVNENNGTVTENEGVITNNNGEVSGNSETVIKNEGTVGVNEGVVETNDADGDIVENQGFVFSNDGSISINEADGIVTMSESGEVAVNAGILYNAAIVADGTAPDGERFEFGSDTLIGITYGNNDNETHVQWIETMEEIYMILNYDAVAEKLGTEKNKKFIGWEDEFGTIYKPGDIYLDPAPLSLTALWKKIKKAVAEKKGVFYGTKYVVIENGPGSFSILGAKEETFLEVFVDDEFVECENYTVSADGEDGILIVFSEPYLKSLSVGEHTVFARFTNGSVSFILTKQ